MVMNFRHGRPRTHWRNVLAAMKTMQDAGLHFTIESFGPFGEVQHGCPTSYGPADGNLFACYKIELGTGYTTIPSGHDTPRPEPWPADVYYKILAHMSRVTAPLFYAEPTPDLRVDKLYTQAHRDALRDYNENAQHMAKRFLQEDGLSVLWHNEDATHATLWNFAARSVQLDGTIIDTTTGQPLAKAERYDLNANRTYAITNVHPLPTRVESVHHDFGDGP